MQTNLLILAAGVGSRLKPLTDNKPKPLVSVNNQPIIESIIESLSQLQLDNIFILTGYFKEQFDYLQYKYSNVSFINNELFSSTNNIYSVYKFIQKNINCNLYMCEGDIYISDKFKLNEKTDESYYYGLKNIHKKNDWGFTLNHNKIKTLELSKFNSHLMAGLSYFKMSDYKKLSIRIIEMVESDHRVNSYWDEAVASILDNIDLKILEIDSGLLNEVDTLSDLHCLEKEIKKRES